MPSPIALIRRIHPRFVVLCLLAAWLSSPGLVNAGTPRPIIHRVVARSKVEIRPAMKAPNSPIVMRIDEHIANAERQINVWQKRIKSRTRYISKIALSVQQPATTSKTRLSGARKRLRKAIAFHLQAWHERSRLRGYVHRMQTARAKVVAALNGGGVSGLPGGRVTYVKWAQSFLASFGAPSCENNLRVVVAWETAESTLARFNPLATTYYLPGASRGPKSNIENYGSFAQGIQAARNTVLTSPTRWGYAPIVDDLLVCAPAGVTAGAIRDSLWCHGCTNGAYVVGRLSTVNGDWKGHEARLVGGG